MRRFTLTAMVLALLLMVGARAAEAAAPTAEEAIQAAVEADGGRYAGPCATTRSPDDIGKICSRLIAEQDGISAYLTGRTFSEFTTWLFVEQVEDGWQVRGTAPLDFLAQELRIPWP